jgi:hypothetical protein
VKRRRGTIAAITLLGFLSTHVGAAIATLLWAGGGTPPTTPARLLLVTTRGAVLAGGVGTAAAALLARRLLGPPVALHLTRTSAAVGPLAYLVLLATVAFLGAAPAVGLATLVTGSATVAATTLLLVRRPSPTRRSGR